MFEAKFLVASERWLAQQRELDRLAPRDTSLAAQVLAAAPEEVLRESTRAPQNFFDPINKLQGQVLSTLSTPDGITSMINLVADTGRRDLLAAQRQAEQLQQAIDTLATHITSPPAPTDAATVRSLLSSLEDSAIAAEQAANKSLLVDPQQATVDTAESILALVDAGVLPRAQVDAYLSGNPVERELLESYMTQVVDSVGDRVWRVRRVEPAARVQGPPATRPGSGGLVRSGVQMVDEDGQPVRDLRGVTEAMLGADGTLIVRGLEPGGAASIFRLVPTSPAPSGRLPQAALKPQGGLLDEKISQVEQAYRFDVWACLMLDIGERIDALFFDLRARVYGLIARVRSAILRILSGEFLGGLPDLEVTWRSPMGRLFSLLDETPVGNPLRAIVAIGPQIKPVQVGDGNLALCGVEQSKYCEAHAQLIDLRKQLEKLDQQLQFKLSGLSVAELASLLGYDPSAVMDVIDAAIQPILDVIDASADAAAALRGQLCAWVRNRQASVPPSLSTMQANVIVLLAAILAAIPVLSPGALGIPVNLDLIRSKDKMRRMGLGSMANSLESIDFADVFFSGYRGGTPAADLAAVLNEASQSSQRLDTSAQLQSMSVSVMDNHMQIVTRQRNRAMMQSRYHSAGPSRPAEDIQNRARPLVREVDREAMLNR